MESANILHDDRDNGPGRIQDNWRTTSKTINLLYGRDMM